MARSSSASEASLDSGEDRCSALRGDLCRALCTPTDLVWSMQLENQRGRQLVLTIEVDLPKRVVCQARKKCNRLPQGVKRELQERWAGRLKVAESIRL